MSADRTSDIAILLSHTMQCAECRDRLLSQPDRVLIGRKISEQQRAMLSSLSAEDFESAVTLAAAAGANSEELRDALNHPRARMRHL